MKRRKRSLFVVGLVVTLASLACSIGVLPASEPPFAAPSGGTLWTETPPIPFPTPGPSPTPADPPGGLGVVQALNPAAQPTVDPNSAPLLYYVQAGDTLPVVAVRFGVEPSEIISPEPLTERDMLTPNQVLVIPHRLANTTSSQKVLPDSEAVYSPSAIDFDIRSFVSQAGGYLNTYEEWLGSTQWTTGADVVQRVALENSIDPRLLLAILEYQSGWVYGQPPDLAHAEYPLGKIEIRRRGLYAQLVWAVNHLSVGYYGWREGLLTDIRFSDGATARLAPDLNAGTVALQYYFAQVYNTDGWLKALDPTTGFPALYEKMFGNPWVRAQTVEPLFPPNLTQPPLILPFFIGQVWSFTGGPHGAWEHDGARAALDFSPARTQSGCVESNAWVLAAAPGLVVRSDNGVVVIDLDGDGLEQTGWALLYLHIANDGRVGLGQLVEAGDLIGHPSCEGGLATGTHVHVARKFNGEWIAADGPIPFVMSGWQAHSGRDPYEGTLTRQNETVTASVVGSFESRIIRDRSEP